MPRIGPEAGRISNSKTKPPVKVAIITTVRHNVGDDFVREGIIHLLEQKFGEVEAWNIHKHAPVTVRNGFDRIRDRRLSAVLDAALPTSIGSDKILNADMVIQSGAPVYWCNSGSHCADSEWFGPLVRKRYSRIQERSPLLNIAAGSGLRYADVDTNRIPLCPRDLDYIREFWNIATLTSVRDRLAQRILEDLGLSAPLIPCTSIFARERLGIEPAQPEFVALNYMEGGGHYDFGEGIDRAAWHATFTKFYREIRNRERCVFVCHNHSEVTHARRIDSDAEILYSDDYRDYLKFYSRAKIGVFNRVHAAFALASFGRPAFVIGSDSRARMTEEIGLDNAFVKYVDFDVLMGKYEDLLASMSTFRDQFEVVKRRALEDYAALLQPL